jgi:adenosine kinase
MIYREMENALKLIITGSIAYDYLMTFAGRFRDHILPDKLDHVSLSFLVDTMKRQQGGTAANIAYSLALLGETPLLVGSAGQDFQQYREFLENSGVDTSGVRTVSDAFTASFFANTDSEGNQICSFYTGAMKYAKENSLQSIATPSDLVIIAPNDPDAMIMLADECRMLNLYFICDPGQQIARFDGEALCKLADQANILILNEYERDLFIKKTGMNEIRLLSMVDVIIVTLGKKGALIRTSEQDYEIPVVKPDVVRDPTGVGDAFRAGLMKGILKGFPWDICGRLGSLAAAYVLETEGPQSHRYHLDEFKNRYIKEFGDSEAIINL